MATLRKLILLSLPVVVPVLLAQGCYTGGQVLDFDCPKDYGPEWAPYCDDAGAGDAGDAGTDGSTGRLCPDTCVPKAPDGWSDPMPHWIGPTDQAPADCPAELGATAVRTFADFEAAPPLECAA